MNSHIPFRIVYVTPAAVWSAVIFYLSSIPGEALPKVEIWSIDKVAHLVIFSVLAAAVLLAAHHTAAVTGRPESFVLTVSMTLCLVYAASDEFHQYFVPNRSCDFLDFLADAAGILLIHFAYRRWAAARDAHGTS